MKRKSGERVEIIFLVTYNGIVVSASLAEMAFQKMSDIKMSAILGYPVCNFSVTPYGVNFFFWNKELLLRVLCSRHLSIFSLFMVLGGSSCK